MRTPRVGHDLVDVARFRKALERREEAWRRRVFTQSEWEAATRRPDRDAVLAAQEAYATTGAFPDLLRIYHLFGDPALKLP